MISTGTKVLEYSFNYNNEDGTSRSPATHRTRLRSIQQCGFDTDGKLCYPATTFDYSGKDSTLPFIGEEEKLTADQVPGPTPLTEQVGNFAGDFNGDGILDALVFDGGNRYIEWLDKNLNLQSQMIEGADYPSSPSSKIKHYYADFNGDGYTDVLQYNYQKPVVNAINFFNPKLYLNKGFNNGSLEFALESQDSASALSDLKGVYISRKEDEWLGDGYEASEPLVSDFNGDGLADIYYGRACVTAAPCSNPTIYFRSKEVPGFISKDINISNTIYSTEQLKLQAGDFDGDGIADIVTQYAPTKFRIESDTTSDNTEGLKTRLNIFFSNGDGTGDEVTIKLDDLLTDIFYIIGDFNNDGISDLFLHDKQEDSTFSQIMLGRGDRTFAKGTRVIGGVQDFTFHNKVVNAGDFNGDGASDLMMYTTAEDFRAGDRAADGIISIYYSNGCSSKKTSPSDDVGCFFQEKSLAGENIVLPSNFINAVGVSVSDVDGDGFSDLYFKTYDYLIHGDRNQHLNEYSEVYLYMNSQSRSEAYETFYVDVPGRIRKRLVKELVSVPSYDIPDMLISVTNGLGVESKLFYKPLTSDVYTKVNEGLAEGELALQSSLYVVAHTETSDGIGGYRSTEYYYSGAKMSRLGRGFLGFSKINIVDPQKALIVESTYSQSFPNVAGILTATKKFIKDDNELIITKSENSLLYEEINHGANKTYFPYISVSKTWVYDIDNPGVEISYSQTTNTYAPQPDESESYGNANQIEVITKPSENATIETLRQVTTNKYSNDTSNWFLGRLWCTSVTETVPGYPVETRYTAYEYYATNGQLKKEIIEPTTTIEKLVGIAENCSTRTDAKFTLTTTHEYDATYGDMTSTTISGSDIDPRKTTVSRTLRNAAAPVITTTNPLAFQTAQTLDARWGTPTKQVGPDGEALRTEWKYDGLGRLKEEIKFQQLPMENLHSYTEYTQGCTGVSTNSGSSWSGWFNMKVKTTNSSGSEIAGEETEICFDTLGRERMKWVKGELGTIRSWIAYDAFGRVSSQSQPVGPSLYYQYDILDRPRRVSTGSVLGNGGLATSFTYDGLNVTSSVRYSDERGMPATQNTLVTNNAIGQKVSVTRYIEGNDTVKTSYKYSPFGNLREIEGPSSEKITYEYDILGRKTKSLDFNLGVVAREPNDEGSRFYTYYSTGELKTFEDAKGQVTENTYDKLGRLVTRIEDKNNATNSLTTTYEYDKAPRGTDTWKGRLNKITQNGDIFAEYTFNGNGYPEFTHLTYSVSNNETYSIKNEYGKYGRLTYTTYPENGLRIKNVYEPYGRLSEIRDATTSDENATLLWRDDERNEKGQLTKATLGNQLVTLRDYDALGRVRLIETGAVSGDRSNKAVQNNSYKFNQLGNLMRRSDGLKGITETFQYDLLNRLRFATVGDRSVEYRYNKSGNLTYRSDLGTLKYEQINNAGPHAVTSVERTGFDVNGDLVIDEQDYRAYMEELAQWEHLRNFGPNDDCNRDGDYSVVDAACIGNLVKAGITSVNPTNYYQSTFEYDANGNLETGGGRDITYTSFNKVDTMQQSRDNVQTSIDFDYTPEHNRYRKTTTVITDHNLPGQTTRVYTTTYVAGLFDKTVKPNGVDTKFYIYADGALVAVKTKSETNNTTQEKTEYAHVDHLGSIELFTASDGSVILDSRTSFDAFGKRRNVDSWKGDDTSARFTTPEPSRGYTGHEQMDSVGLVHMNGRIYDPVLGRFMTPDPYIAEMYNSQSLNRFSYVYNNPLSLVDPSGYISVDFDNVERFMTIALYTFISYYFGPVGSFLVGMQTSGGDFQQAAIYALTSYVTGHTGAAGSFTTALAHGVIGGLGSLLSGEGFGQGFRTSFASSYLGAGANSISSTAGRMVAQTVVGGTVSVIGGGKFANGAIGSAFGFIYANSGPNENLVESQLHASEKQVGSKGDGEWGYHYAGGGARDPRVTLLGRAWGTITAVVVITRFAVVSAYKGIVKKITGKPYSHGYDYDPRVRKRAVEDPSSHNFPYSFDDEILATDPIHKKNGYRIFQKRGSMAGSVKVDPDTGKRTQTYKDGVFEIGVTKDGVIDHRFFRPDKGI